MYEGCKNEVCLKIRSLQDKLKDSERIRVGYMTKTDPNRLQPQNLASPIYKPSGKMSWKAEEYNKQIVPNTWEEEEKEEGSFVK